MHRSGLSLVDLKALSHDGQLTHVIDGAESLLTQELPPLDRLLTLQILGSALFNAGNVTASLAVQHRALAAADAVGTAQPKFEAALALFAKESQFQSPEEALPSLVRTRQLAAEISSAAALGSLHLAVARIEAIRGLYSSSRGHLNVSQRLLNDVGGSYESALRLVSSSLEGSAGNLEAAEQAARSGIVEAESAGCTTLKVSSLVNLGSVLVLRSKFALAGDVLNRAKVLGRELSFVRLSIAIAMAQIALRDIDACAERLAECKQLIAEQIVPARSWYDLTHQATRCAFHERNDEWPDILAIVDEVDTELTRRQYRALRTTLLCAKARALAALGEHDHADHTVAAAVSACPRSAVDPLIVLEATRAACDAFRGRTRSASTRFERAVAGCKAIGHHYHEHWIVELRAKLLAKNAGQVSQSQDANAAPGEVLADLAAILRSGNSIDLLAHRTTAFLKSTLANGRIETDSTGGHEYQATPTVEISEDAHGHSLSLRSSDRRVRVSVPRVESLDDIVLMKNVSDVVRLAIARAADTENEDDAPNLWPSSPIADDDDAVFRSPRMQELLRVAMRLADSPMPVLITGETGTGKEIIARLIHAHSPNRRGPFMPFNGPSISKDLVETQLFGHRRGAFTGAHESTQGTIRAAEGGTLFLDEVGDLEPSVQPKLLRFIESGEIQPVGDAKPVSVRVRLVAATNADLEALSREGRFRKDLYFRLNVAPIVLPPLRERKDEIPAMASLFLNKASKECGRTGLRISDDFVAALLLYDWPGNIRELVNEVRRAVALAHDGDTLTARDLAPGIARRWLERPTVIATPSPGRGVFVRLDQPLNQAIKQVEEQFIERALDVTGGRVTEAARLLGLSRKGLFLKRRRREQRASVATDGASR